MSVRVKRQIALRQAELIFAQEIRPALNKLGDELRERVRSRMREDTGREKAGVKKRIRGSSYRLSLEVYGDTPQALVDERGRRAGAKLPPFKRGSALYKWVGRKGLADSTRGLAKLSVFKRDLFNQRVSAETITRRANRAANRAQEAVAFLVARKIARDGIPARKPFERTKEESHSFIRESCDAAINRAVERLNA